MSVQMWRHCNGSCQRVLEFICSGGRLSQLENDSQKRVKARLWSGTCCSFHGVIVCVLYLNSSLLRRKWYVQVSLVLILSSLKPLVQSGTFPEPRPFLLLPSSFQLQFPLSTTLLSLLESQLLLRNFICSFLNTNPVKKNPFLLLFTKSLRMRRSLSRMKRWVNNVNPRLSLAKNHPFLFWLLLLIQPLLLDSQHYKALCNIAALPIHFRPSLSIFCPFI